MKIIKPSVEELVQEDIYRHIEICGRTCYKSEDKICDGSAEKFVNMLKNHNHGAMLEHGTIYLTINFERMKKSRDKNIVNQFFKLIHNKYTDYKVQGDTYYITTNYRVAFENKLEKLVEKYATEPTEKHFIRRTFRITCNRGISHELVRHRVFSFAMESQRYIGYTKEKFGKEIKVIEPLYFPQDSDKYSVWKTACEEAERKYFELTNLGCSPQEAREVLPNSCATELIMTGFEYQWEELLRLRCATDAHPQAREVANLIKEKLLKE